MLMLALALAACGPPPAPAPRSPPAAHPRVAATPAALGVEATVKRVVDGDTLLVTGVDRRQAVLVRLTGIDAPETGDGRTVRECFGPEARAWLAGQVSRGSRVRLVFDVGERDRFGRRLAYVYRADGTFLNAALVENGYARTMTIRPNVRHAATLRALERRARADGRGLWAACGNR